MIDLIDRKALVNNLELMAKYQSEHKQSTILGVCMTIKSAPTIDAVSMGVFEQVKWERDVAIAQLEELGIGFGQKKPDMVEVVRCKNCKYWGTDYSGQTGYIKECKLAHYMTGHNGYCVYGEKIEGDIE